jgi:hypothetical protein
MNADLTFNSVVFKKSFDEKDGSERRSTARGINTPDVMVIKRTPYTDSVTKVAGTRYLMRIDRYDLDANLVGIITSAYVVIAVPSTAANLATVLVTFKAAVADADLLAAVLNSES